MSAVSPNANIPDGSKGAATCLLCSLLILCEIKRIWREGFIRKTDAYGVFSLFPTDCTESTDYARALLVLACIAGYLVARRIREIHRLLRIAPLPLALIADNISLPQTTRKAQNYARALLVLACIAGYFSGTQNAQNTQTFADCFAPAGLRGVGG